MVGDPGIEPGMGLPGGVTVRCRTLQPVALKLVVTLLIIQMKYFKASSRKKIVFLRKTGLAEEVAVD